MKFEFNYVWLNYSAAGLLIVLLEILAQDLIVSYSSILVLLSIAIFVSIPMAIHVVSSSVINNEKFNLSRIRKAYPLASYPIIISFFLENKLIILATLIPWMVFTLYLLVMGVKSLFDILFRKQSLNDDLSVVLTDLAFIFIPVGSFWLILSRTGNTLFNTPEPFILLTSIHFHYTGFLLILLIAISGEFIKNNKNNHYKFYKAGSLGLIGSIPIIAIGIAFSPFLEWIGVMVIYFSIVNIEIVLFLELRKNGSLNILFVISILSAILAISLALVYGISEFFNLQLLSIGQMITTHAWINAIGFVFIQLLAWIRYSKPQINLNSVT